LTFKVSVNFYRYVSARVESLEENFILKYAEVTWFGEDYRLYV